VDITRIHNVQRHHNNAKFNVLWLWCRVVKLLLSWLLVGKVGKYGSLHQRKLITQNAILMCCHLFTMWTRYFTHGIF